MRSAWVGLALAVAMSFLIGCGKEGPAVEPASGVVTYQGEPLAGARVMFHPAGEGARSSHGTTDANGRFKLSTFGMNDGALVGKHVVTVSKVEMSEEATKIDVKALQEKGYAGGGMPGYESMMGTGGKAAEVKQEIPEKYADKKTSGIEVEVTVGGDNEFPINLD